MCGVQPNVVVRQFIVGERPYFLAADFAFRIVAHLACLPTVPRHSRLPWVVAALIRNGAMNVNMNVVALGLVAVLMQRHPGANWDDPARDVSALIQWVEGNIGKYKGNPERMFIWAHSAGNGPLGTYIGHPQLWGPKGVGVKGDRQSVV